MDAHLVFVVDTYYGSPPSFSLTKSPGFETSSRSYLLKYGGCPSTPRRRRSIGLGTQESIWILCFQLHPSLCRPALKRLLSKKIVVRISQLLVSSIHCCIRSLLFIVWTSQLFHEVFSIVCTRCVLSHTTLIFTPIYSQHNNQFPC